MAASAFHSSAFFVRSPWRRLVGGAGAVIVLCFVIAASFVVAVAALSLAALAAVGVAGVWAFARLTQAMGRGRGSAGRPRASESDRAGETGVLEAHRGPRGWTVDTPSR